MYSLIDYEYEFALIYIVDYIELLYYEYLSTTFHICQPYFWQMILIFLSVRA